MPLGAAHRFSDLELGNLTEDNLNALDAGGNVYVVGPGSLLVNVSPVRYVTTLGALLFPGAAGLALPAATVNIAIYLTVPGNVLTQNAAGFPVGEHLPLAECDTSGVEVIAVRDRRHAQASAVAPAPVGDVVGPAAATDGGVALYNGATGKLLKDGPVPGAAAGLATLAAGKVVQDPANAQTAAAAAKIPLGNGAGKLEDAWLQHNPVFGANPVTQESAARQTEATAVFKTHSTLAVPAFTGVVRVEWNGELDNAGFAGEVHLHNDTDVVVVDGPQIITAGAAGDKLPVGGWADVAMTGGAKSFSVRFRDVAGANTQGLQGVKVSAYRRS